MRFAVSLPVFILAFAAAAAAGNCAICPDTLPPGVSEIGWRLVFHRDVADNQMFCGYRGAERDNPHPVQTFCVYNDNNGTRIENEQGWDTCPQTVKVKKCDK
ncbi:hypothetical protein MSAN_02512100 [Mycena sanguinolenta]|uniref:Secreted protein n=1 Tax=Mycena sanguinolenta TaxID=230812 RepID=A0A8H6TW14_9AGAR|nr:hypothetical protein MSAN_02512100 [Mycena sanguinolenta]